MIAEPLKTQSQEDAEMSHCYEQLTYSQVVIKGMQPWEMGKTSFKITKNNYPMYVEHTIYSKIR